MPVRIAYSQTLTLQTIELLAEKCKSALTFFKNTWYHCLRAGKREIVAFMLKFIRENSKDPEDEKITPTHIEILTAGPDHQIDAGKLS